MWSDVVWSGLVFAETSLQNPHQLKPHQWPYQWLAVVSNMCTKAQAQPTTNKLCVTNNKIVKTVCTSTTDNQQTYLELQTTK
jgi:hypothetical protein